jgi:hypothetical protein
MARYDRDTIDDGSFMPSLAALDVLSGVKALDSVKMPYDTTKPATTTTMPFDGTTTPSVKNLDTTTLDRDVPAVIKPTVPQAAVPATSINTTTIAGINAASGIATTTNVATPATTATAAVSTKPDPTKTAYADLTPAQRAAMSQQEKVDYLKAARDAQDAAEAKARAATNPMYNYAVRPDAPVKAGMIQYYSWIGDTTSGQWKLYSAPDTPENQAKYGARSTGGPTQATPDSPVGANSLVQPPVWDPESSTWKPAGFTPATTTKTTVTTTNPATTVTTTKPITSTASLTTTPVVGSNYSGSGSVTDPFTVDGKPYTGSLFGSTYNNGVVVDMAAKTADDIAKQGRLDARTEFSNTLKALGLPQNLVDELDNMIKQDYTKSQMYLELQKTPAWKERFPGMEGLAKAGKAVDAGTYISMEKGFLQTLDYYGIDKKIFGTTAELGKQIGNLVSPKAFEDRVSLAAQDVEQNPDVLSQLNLYYGVDKSAAISYLLNPEIGLDIIKRQARAAEIGAKAAASKFDFGTAPAGSGVAESFINAAGTMDLQSLGTAFQQARQLAGNQTRLAQLEGASYNDLEAVSAILGKDQAAILDSQRRAAREGARFGGASGLSSGSLKKETTI